MTDTPEYPPLDTSITALAQIPEGQWPVMVGHLCEAWDLRYQMMMERVAALEATVTDLRAQVRPPVAAVANGH